jgi:hypothetical protein
MSTRASNQHIVAIGLHQVCTGGAMDDGRKVFGRCAYPSHCCKAAGGIQVRYFVTNTLNHDSLIADITEIFFSSPRIFLFIDTVGSVGSWRVAEGGQESYCLLFVPDQKNQNRYLLTRLTRFRFALPNN